MSERKTRRVVAFVVVLAVLASALVARGNLGFDDASLQAAWVFALLGVLANVLAYHITRSAVGNISFIPLLAAVAVAPTFAVVLSATLAAGLTEVLQRRERLKVAFNVAQYALAVSVSILVFRALNGQPVDGRGVHSVAAFALSFVAFFVTNTLCVSGVIAVSTNQRMSSVIWQNTHSALVYDVVAIPAVYGIAFLYARLGAAWSIVFVIPLFGLRHFYKTNWQLERLNEELLQIMVAAIEARDPYTSGHSQRVAAYVRIVAKVAGLGTRAIERIATAALLHDVGKIHEEFASILRKPGRLSGEEFAVMKTHSEKGAQLVGKSSQFYDLVPAIRGHHESWDGRGYPAALKGEAIPAWSRFIALADTIDAMATNRPYRDALSAETIRIEIAKQSGVQFDPLICEIILNPSHWPELQAAIVANTMPRAGVTLGSNGASDAVVASDLSRNQPAIAKA